MCGGGRGVHSRHACYKPTPDLLPTYFGLPVSSGERADAWSAPSTTASTTPGPSGEVAFAVVVADRVVVAHVRGAPRWSPCHQMLSRSCAQDHTPSIYRRCFLFLSSSSFGARALIVLGPPVEYLLYAIVCSVSPHRDRSALDGSTGSTYLQVLWWWWR